MFHSASGASTHAPRPTRTGISAGLPAGPTAGPDSKQFPSARNTAQGSYVLAVVNPWLKERKALDLRKNAVTPQQLSALLAPLLDPAREMSNARAANALRSICRVLGDPIAPPLLKTLVESVHTAALRRDDWLAGCQFAYDMLAGIAQPPNEKVLTSLLAAVLPGSEAPPEAALMVTAWFELAARQMDEDRFMPFLVRALDQMPPTEPAVLLNAMGRIATQWMLRLADKPEQMLPQFGQLASWLLRQPPEHAREGLSGLGQGLNASAHWTVAHLCEMLQAVAALRADAQAADTLRGLRRLANAMAGDDGLLPEHSLALLQHLHTRSQAATAPMPRDEVLATLDGLVWGTLAPDMTAAQLASEALPLGRIAQLTCLSLADLERVGTTIVQALGGAQINPAVLGALAEQISAAYVDADPDAQRTAALLRGMVRAAGGADMNDARLSALAEGLGVTEPGLVLVGHLAQALGAVGAGREAARAQLATRLPGCTPLKLGLELQAEPLSVLSQWGWPVPQAARLLAAVWRVPGVLDAASLPGHLWHCALLAQDHGPLAIEAAALLVECSRGVTVAQLRELRGALMAQALAVHPKGPPPAWTQAMAGLYRQFLEHGVFDSAPSATATGKGKLKKGHPVAPVKGSAAQDSVRRFLQEEITWLGQGRALAPLRPLALALGELLPSPAPILDAKR
ncbi:MAG: hypothetical protein V4609_02945 [Pseudomonadota bacterium]